MAETIQRKINDSPAARWTALVLIALMMFFGYMFVDVMSPLKSLIESARGWDSGTFGTYAASEYFLNVFFFFLIFAGIILDKMGIRFTGLLSASLMVIGAAIKFVGISDWFQATQFCAWLNSWWVSFPGSAKMASLGFMIFGCGCEMAGTTVSKAIAKWFEGKEMALAMGLEMAIARLGVFAVMWLSPMIAKHFDMSVVAPVAFCTVLLIQNERTNNGILKMLALPVSTSSLCLAKFILLVALAAVYTLASAGAYYISAALASGIADYNFILAPGYVLPMAGKLFLASFPMLTVFWMIAVLITTPIFSVGAGLASIVPSVLLINTKIWFLYPMCYPFYVLVTEYGNLAKNMSSSPIEMIPWIPTAVAVSLACLIIASLSFGRAERR